ncbi:MAG: pentapeptide repeat-containing protein [Proteobacteria bacterium]|nr:pentapeptide repeat-containing protein [Pseudomonadota bacterium]
MRADLRRSNFQGASFEMADLQGAKIQGTDLREAKAFNFEQSIWDETTQWPEGFSPPPPGAKTGD